MNGYFETSRPPRAANEHPHGSTICAPPRGALLDSVRAGPNSVPIVLTNAVMRSVERYFPGFVPAWDSAPT